MDYAMFSLWLAILFAITASPRELNHQQCVPVSKETLIAMALKSSNPVIIERGPGFFRKEFRYFYSHQGMPFTATSKSSLAFPESVMVITWNPTWLQKLFA